MPRQLLLSAFEDCLVIWSSVFFPSVIVFLGKGSSPSTSG